MRRAPLALALAATLLLLAGGLAAADESALQRVETKKVCMVNDQLFGRDQIPIQVEGRTYYGCCEMCKERLARDAAARTSVDPQTKKPVDKATAVIAARPDGSVLYFESEKTFAEYQKKAGGEKSGEKKEGGAS
jgi:YHS domain-containing protein